MAVSELDDPPMSVQLSLALILTSLQSKIYRDSDARSQ